MRESYGVGIGFVGVFFLLHVGGKLCLWVDRCPMLFFGMCLRLLHWVAVMLKYLEMNLLKTYTWCVSLCSARRSISGPKRTKYIIEKKL